MPEPERFTELLESLADGTPVDWAAAESAMTSDDDRAWLRQLRRLELAVAHQRRFPARAAHWSYLELIEKIGAGAFGEVYRAHDPRLARDVALKLLYEPMSADGARASAVIEEGRLLARVRHPNVVTVYGAECRDGQVGIWTEFIDGQTLQAIVAARGPLPPAEVTAIGLDLCRALAAVHDAGLLHRDIKAQNVMREAGGRIVLMDFGTGRDLDPSPGQRTDVSGTPLYLAPELFTGGEASAASDIYALGVLLFFLLTGRYPVPGRTVEDVREGHLAGVAASVGELQPGASSALVRAVERALDRDPARRFASARELEEGLLAAQPAVAGRGDNRQVARAEPRRRRFRLVAALSVLVVLAGATWWSLAHQPAEIGQQAAETRAAANSGDHRESNTQTASPILPSPTPVEATPKLPTRPAAAPGEERTVVPDLLDNLATISPDGRWLARLDRIGDLATGDMVLEDLSTHAVVRLGLRSGEDLASLPAFSPDSRRLAYQWKPKNDAKARLGVVEVPRVPGREPQFFVEDPDNVEMVHDWSPDGQSVLVTLVGPGSRGRLAWVSTIDGSIVTVKEFNRNTEPIIPRARVSINGEIAYVRRIDGVTQHIYLISKDSRDEAIVNDTARNFWPLWWPDGKRLFYTSNVSSSIDLWSIAIRGGRADGLSAPVRVNIGEGTAVALTADGSYYYRNLIAKVDQIFVATGFDPPGPPANTPTITNVLVGVGPRWSPDSQSLAFLRQTPYGWNLVVKSLRDATDRIVFPDAAVLPMFWLSASQLLVQSRVTTGARTPNRVDLAAKATTATRIGEDLETGVVRTSAAALSLDGKTLYTGARMVRNGPWDRLVAIDVATGLATLVWQMPQPLFVRNSLQQQRTIGLALSPDGRELAVAMRAEDGARLIVVGVDGREYRELYGPYWTNSTLDKVSWTTRGIYFSEAVATTTTGLRQVATSWQVMRIAPEGGTPHPLFEINGSDSGAGFDVSADGSRIAVHPAPGVPQPFSPSTGQGNRLWTVNLKSLEALRKR